MTDGSSDHTITMRYFAGVADAAGAREERLSVPAGATISELSAMLRGLHGQEFSRLFAMSAVLIGGKRAEATARIPMDDDVLIDVLPPFAGG